MTRSRAQAPPLPPDVFRYVSHLANLLDDRLAVRGAGSAVRDVAGAFLGVPPTELIVATTEVLGLRYQLAGLALAADLDRQPPVAVVGDDADSPPQWARLKLGDDSPRIPVSLAASLESGPVAKVPMVFQVEKDWSTGGFDLRVYTVAADAEAGQAHLDDLLRRGRRQANPYRNKVLEASTHQLLGLTFRVVAPVPTRREDVVLPDEVWAEIANRGRGGGEELNDFLLAPDGAMSRHAGVATVATTNAVDAIDPAARRAARFDRVVTVGPPDRAARAVILRRLLKGLDADGVDPDRVAAATSGATGADLRELVSLAVLHVANEEGAELDTELLVELAQERSSDDPPGLYL